jgi:hypothetical protein
MARFDVFIPANEEDGVDLTLRVTADTWMAALKVGLKKIGDASGVPKNVLCDIQDDESIHVTDPRTNRVFRIAQIPEVSNPGLVNAPKGSWMEPPGDSPPDKAAAERAVQERALQQRAAEERAAAEKLAQRAAEEQAQAARAAEERAAAERAAAENAAAVARLAAARAAEDQAAAKAEEDRKAAERAAGERAAAEKAASEKAAQARLTAEKAAAESRAAEARAAAEKAASEKAAAEARQAAAAAEREKAEQQRAQAAKARPPSARLKPPPVKVVEVARPKVPPPPQIGRTESDGGAALEDVLAELLERTPELFQKQGQEALYFLLDLAMEKVPSDAGTVYVADLNRRDLRFAAVRGPKAAELLALNLRVPMGKGFVGFCAQEGVAVAISDAQRDRRFFSEISQRIGYETKSMLTTPITLHGRTLGAIQLINRKSTSSYTPSELSVLHYLAHQGALLLEAREV